MSEQSLDNLHYHNPREDKPKASPLPNSEQARKFAEIETGINAGVFALQTDTQDRLHRVHTTRGVVVFGSWAQGKASPSSDLDYFLLIKGKHSEDSYHQLERLLRANPAFPVKELDWTGNIDLDNPTQARAILNHHETKPLLLPGYKIITPYAETAQKAEDTLKTIGKPAAPSRSFSVPWKK